MQLIARRCGALIGFLFLALPTQAQLAVNDVSLRIEISAPLPWELGTPQETRLILRNFSNRATIGRIRLEGLGNPFLLIDNLQFVSESCTRKAGCSQFGATCYDTPIIPAGGEAVCIEGKLPLAIRERPYFVRYIYEDLTNFVDVNPANNSADLQITLRAVQLVTAVPVSPVAYFGMALVLLGFGLFAARRA